MRFLFFLAVTIDVVYGFGYISGSADELGENCIAMSSSTYGICDRKNIMRFIVNSCGDITGSRQIAKTLEATGVDISNDNTKDVFSNTWAYMETLNPDSVFLLGDNVYNDGIANHSINYHPFGTNFAAVLTDASVSFQKYHGFLAADGTPGPILYSYLEILKDKIHDGYHDNAAFQSLRTAVSNNIHVTWDDHDYMTNDPSNPHHFRSAFRKAAVDELTGWDRKFFRYSAPHKGVERAWTHELDNKGTPFYVKFIVLDEETTHNGTQGCEYYRDPASETGFSPGLKDDPSAACPDMSYIEDFEEPKRDFFGDDQLEWFKNELMSGAADLIFVINGGPNFEIDYAYNALTDFPGAKRKFIEVLRESGSEHVIFLGGDSHATYVTKTPNIVGYPLYTIIGSGFTSGLSYDRYVSFWGDISHRFLVAAGSTAKNNAAASFAEVEILFDPEPMVRFTPHLADDLRSEGGPRWGGWYEQKEANSDEPWAAQYDIKISELEISHDFPQYHTDPTLEHKFVTENIYFKWQPSTGTEGVGVTLTIVNQDGNSADFEVQSGFNCGSDYFGFCKDRWGAFAYIAPKVGDYTPSLVNQEICEHAGYVGDQISWTLTAISQSSGEVLETTSGSLTLKIRNNVLINSAGDLDDLHFYNTQANSVSIVGDSIGITVPDILAEPILYGGYKVPVLGYDEESNSFDDADVQTSYASWAVGSTSTADFQDMYLSTYYPDLPEKV